jgi:hypothetical protein
MKINFKRLKQAVRILFIISFIVFFKVNLFSQSKNNKPHLRFKDSFIGKTNLEIESLHLNSCNFVTLSTARINEKDSIIISFLCEDDNNCMNSKNKIVLQQLIDTTQTGQLIYMIKDELVVDYQHPVVYDVINLNDGKQLQGDFLIKYRDKPSLYIDKIKAIWKIDMLQLKFIKKPIPKKIEFQNPRECFAFNY